MIMNKKSESGFKDIGNRSLSGMAKRAQAAAAR
jgi:hypothetical protein